ncbi:MAG: glycosyltransferase family 4 protein [Muribaculaceae bacterium]|nr:glycosyltransferase family 4 protein [Muribaculaceae bacterium]
MIRIGFDGKRAVSNMTGLGNYSRLVIEEVGKKFQHYANLQNAPSSDNKNFSFSQDTSINPETGKINNPKSTRDFGMYISTPKEDPEDTLPLLVYTEKLTNNPRLEPIRRLKNIEFRFPPAAGFSGALWRTFGVTNNIVADKCDIYHGLSNELPLNIAGAKVKSVVTIHDIIYRRLPYCYHLPDRIIYDYKYGKSCKNADRIIAVSECTKRDIMEFYGIPEEKIDVVYQGCSDIFRQEFKRVDFEDIRRRLDLPDNFIIQVGTIEKRKNLELTLRALSSLPRINLVVVGADHHGYKREMIKLSQELGISDRVKFLNKVDFRDLPLLYSLADCSLYPSFYEGFGIPILESLERNTPVIAAKGSCLEEAGGEGAIYIDPANPREMAESIRFFMDSTNREEYAAKGKKHAQRFDNNRMADSILKTYAKVLDTDKLF